MARYKWRAGMPRPKVSADTFGEVVERLGGVSVATPKQVVEAARSARSPIHRAFEWDEHKNSESFLLRRAQELIGGCQLVRVHIKPSGYQSTRAFHCVTVDGKRGYVHHDRIMASADLRRQVITDAAERLESFIVLFARHAAVVGKYFPALKGVITSMRQEIETIELGALP